MPAFSFATTTELFEFIADAVRTVAEEPFLQECLMQRVSEHKFRDLLPAFRQFACQSALTLQPDESRVYIDGCWDIMHSGHFNAIRQAKQLGKTLVVGVHSDEEIIRNKGCPVMNTEERVAMVRACKWADEVVLNAPYSPTLQWLDQHHCQFIAHGDDIAINSHGYDAYGELKQAGRFKVIKRTEGISTTALVGKLLLMTRDALEGLSEPLVASAASNFLMTSTRISEFANNRPKLPGSRVVYIDGAFDLFHIGHVEMLKKAKELGDFLVVGIHDDATVNSYKGLNFPIMSLHERTLNVLATKYVDEVVIGAPWILTEDLVKSLNISLVVQSSSSKQDCNQSREADRYAYPKSVSMYVEIRSERAIDTCDIVQRIVSHRLNHINKFTKTSAKEATYYKTKTYVQEL